MLSNAPHLCFRILGNPTVISKFIEKGDVSGAKSLDLQGRMFTSFCDMESFKSCTEINIKGNKVRDLSGFQRNFQLRHLRAADNNISNVMNNDLQNLTNLLLLDLSQNKLNDFLENVTIKVPSLKTLNLIGNEISSVSGLDRFPNF
eukprot:GHVP01014605.1.p2 GENE.GHVP01014605.1~~GHVP01014605.1.p2  ORF type:complete len:146 (+),score=26.65 GHVP01014605.1:1501-1938(+)